MPQAQDLSLARHSPNHRCAFATTLRHWPIEHSSQRQHHRISPQLPPPLQTNNQIKSINQTQQKPNKIQNGRRRKDRSDAASPPTSRAPKRSLPRRRKSFFFEITKNKSLAAFCRIGSDQTRSIYSHHSHSDLFKQKVNEHCFERAIPTPGSSISSAEQTQFTNCMEKYMAAWNTTSRQYLGHLQKGAGAGGM